MQCGAQQAPLMKWYAPGAVCITSSHICNFRWYHTCAFVSRCRVLQAYIIRHSDSCAMIVQDSATLERALPALSPPQNINGNGNGASVRRSKIDLLTYIQSMLLLVVPSVSSNYLTVYCAACHLCLPCCAANPQEPAFCGGFVGRA